MVYKVVVYEFLCIVEDVKLYRLSEEKQMFQDISEWLGQRIHTFDEFEAWLNDDDDDSPLTVYMFEREIPEKKRGK